MNTPSSSLSSPQCDVDLDPLLRNLARAFDDDEDTISNQAELTQNSSQGSLGLAADILDQARFGNLSTSQELEPGTVLGSYRLLEVLGVGGMSTVYRAEHIAMRRRVAVKVLAFSLATNKQFVDRFYREAQAAARLDHPNVVKVHDINTQGNIHFLVMEFVAGKTIRETVDAGGPLSVPQAISYLQQATSALAHAHRQGIVHRDIKPENLVLESTGRIKLLDLGLARLSEVEDRLLTVYDTMLGTVDYIAPEQAENSHNVDARADIYSLGCTLYFMLAGHPPFPTGTPAQRLMFHLLKQPPKVSDFRSDVAPALDALLRRMMAKAPEDRPQSSEELLTALEACQAGESGSAAPPPATSSMAPAKAAAPATTLPAAPVPAPPVISEVASTEPDLPPTPPGQTALWSPTRKSPSEPTAKSQPKPSQSAASQRAAESSQPAAEVRVTVRKLLELRTGRLDPDVAQAVREKIKTHPQVADIHQRIETVVARHWLEAPALDDPNMDPNDVAAYLDNMMGERGARTNYEKLCVAGDAYLAETADCLAIVTAQPAADPRRSISASTRTRLYAMSERLASIERRVGQLAEGLNDKDTFVRELSAEALGRIGPDAFGAAERLSEAVDDPDRKVRDAVQDALRKIQRNESGGPE